MTVNLQGKSTIAELLCRYLRICWKNWRRRPDLNRRMEVLQTSALPLGYGALSGMTASVNCRGRENGAGNGIRTRDFDLGKVALYH